MESSQTLGDVSVRRRIPEGGWTPGSVPGKTLSPVGGWIGGPHIDWRRERMLARTLGPKGVWIVRSYIGWREERRILYKGETLRGSPEVQTHQGQHLLAVGLLQSTQTLRLFMRWIVAPSGVAINPNAKASFSLWPRSTFSLRSSCTSYKTQLKQGT